jgi:hypothetical protein
MQVRDDKITDDSQGQNEPRDSEESHVSFIALYKEDRPLSGCPLSQFSASSTKRNQKP